MVCCFSIRKLLDSFERGETQLIVSVSLELEKILQFGVRREGHQVQQSSLHSNELVGLIESVVPARLVNEVLCEKFCGI